MKRYQPLLENKYGFKPLIVIPHAGLFLPPELELEDILITRDELMMASDIDCDNLYNPVGLYKAQMIKFPYHRAFIDVNELPEDLDACVPLTHWKDSGYEFPIYKLGKIPSKETRQKVANKYTNMFFNKIKEADKTFIFCGHASNIGDVGDKGSHFEADIEISDRQMSKDGSKLIKTAPEGYLEEYFKNLEKQFEDYQPNDRKIVIKVNTDFTVNTYGNIEGTFGWNGKGEKGFKAPLILQETNEYLYTIDDKRTTFEEDYIDYKRRGQLRRRISKALFDTLCTMQKYKN